MNTRDLLPLHQTASALAQIRQEVVRALESKDRAAERHPNDEYLIMILERVAILAENGLSVKRRAA